MAEPVKVERDMTEAERMDMSEKESGWSETESGWQGRGMIRAMDFMISVMVSHQQQENAQANVLSFLIYMAIR